MSDQTKNSRDIHRDVIAAIEAWEPLEGPLAWSEERFLELARPIFAHQYAHNRPYREFCRREGAEPGDLESVAAIPAVSTEVFKHVELVVERAGAGDVVRTFRTSGTTQGLRGAHHFRTLEAYRASLHPPFRRFCNPDGEQMRMLVVAQSPEDAPDSSLSFMLGELVERWGGAGSEFFVGRGSDGDGFCFEALAVALDRAEDEGARTMLLGTAFGFAEFFDWLAEGRSWRLPAGSRLMETGGFKGYEREITREELYAAFETRFGLPRERCLGEYSMTELSSQAYTREGRAFYAPPWARILLVDPHTLEPFEEPGRKGLIRWVDLANVDSVTAVQTGDLGTKTADGGLLLHGRAPGADLRGCSLTVEEIRMRDEG